MTFSLLTCAQDLGQLRQGRPLLQFFPGFISLNLAPLLDSRVLNSLEVGHSTGTLWQFPLLPDQITRISQKRLQAKAAQTAKNIINAGASILGLEQQLRPLAPVFQGQGLQVASGAALGAAAAINLALHLSPAPREQARVLVISPGGGLGTAAARVLARYVRYLILMGNYLPSLVRLARRILLETGTACIITRPEASFLAEADIVMDFSRQDLSSLTLKSGAVVWQPAGKTQLDPGIQALGEIILQTGLSVPLESDLPPGLVRASSAEALLMAVALRAPWPRTITEVTPDLLCFAARLAKQQGFRLAGYQNSSYRFAYYLTNTPREFIIC